MMLKKYLFIVFIPIPILGMTVDHAYFQLGQALKQSNNILEAVLYFEKTVASNPGHVDALFELGMYHYQNGEIKKAFDYFTAILAHNPHHRDAGLNAGSCALALQKIDVAIELYKKVIQQEPRLPKAHFLLAMTYQANHQLPLAIESFKTTIALSPESWEAHFHLANALRLNHTLSQALHHYEKALEKNPGNMAITFEYANALSQSGNIEHALALYEELRIKNYHSPSLLYNMAHTYKKKGDYAQSVFLYRTVLHEKPHNHQAHYGLASAYLAQGEYTKGFQELALSTKIHLTEKPLLHNISDAYNKTIIITASWNNEDMIQFLRYLPLLKKAGARLIVQADALLTPLLKLLPYIDSVLEHNAQSVAAFDMHIPMIAIPALFSHLALPDAPYLPQSITAHPRWRTIASHSSNIHTIGIYWQSRESFDDQAEDKNIPFELLTPLLQNPSLHCYALNQLQPAELAALPSESMITVLGKSIQLETDIVSLTHLLTTFDSIITGDSMVAHLAGALGKPTILMLPGITSWRWIARDGYSVFYPSIRIIRYKKESLSTEASTIQEYIGKCYSDHNCGILKKTL